MKKSRGIAGLLGTILMIALLAYTVSFGWGGSHSGAMKNIKLGLDLAGGVSITYQTKEKNPSDEDMRDTVYKLQKRVETYSTEAVYIRKATDGSVFPFRVYRTPMKSWKNSVSRELLSSRRLTEKRYLREAISRLLRQKAARIRLQEPTSIW